MADLNLNVERPKVNIAFTDEDGVEHKHQFEVLPLTKPRYEETMRFAQQGRELAKTDDPDPMKMAPMMVEFCDKLLRSTNGPVTVASLWNEGALPFAWVMRIADHLKQETLGNPPA